MSIPHKLYFYWGQGTHITYLRYLSMATWRYHHPDWEIYCYQSQWGKTAASWNFHEFQSFSRRRWHDYSEEAKSILGVRFETYEPEDKVILDMPPPNISDIFSYDILRRVGGWYSDMDVICVKNHDYISDLEYSFVGFGDMFCWVGQFGAKPGSWVMESFYQPCIANYSKYSYNSTGTFGLLQSCTGNMEWQNKFNAGDPTGGKNWCAPREMFYPVLQQMTGMLWGPDWVPGRNTWTVHLYGGNQDYALTNKRMTGPSWIRDVTHMDWVSRYARTLDKHLMLLDLDVDPKPPEAHDKHTMPDIRTGKDASSDVRNVDAASSAGPGANPYDDGGEQKRSGDAGVPVSNCQHTDDTGGPAVA